MKVLPSNFLPRLIGHWLNFKGLLAPQASAQTALQLFCKPRKGRLSPADHSFLDSCEASETIGMAAQTTTAYFWNRKGQKKVLLLHGWESNSARWQRLIAYLLREDMAIIAIDAPGHGRAESQTFDMLQYAQAIDAAVDRFQPQAIVGHSMGGASLCYYLNAFSVPPFQQLVLMGVPSELSSMIANFTNVLGLSQKMKAAFNDAFEAHFNTQIAYFSAATFCLDIQTPTLVIHDRGDTIAAVNDGQRCFNNLAQGALLLTDELGHSLQGEVVYERIAAFLAPADR